MEAVKTALEAELEYEKSENHEKKLKEAVAALKQIGFETKYTHGETKITLVKTTSNFEVEIQFQVQEENYEEFPEEDEPADAVSLMVPLTVRLTNAKGTLVMNVSADYESRDITPTGNMQMIPAGTTASDDGYLGPYFETLDSQLGAAISKLLASHAIDAKLCQAVGELHYVCTTCRLICALLSAADLTVRASGLRANALPGLAAVDCEAFLKLRGGTLLHREAPSSRCLYKTLLCV
jgi:hypothetical protein